jgi:hypothetical protein
VDTYKGAADDVVEVDDEAADDVEEVACRHRRHLVGDIPVFDTVVEHPLELPWVQVPDASMEKKTMVRIRYNDTESIQK